MQLFKPIVASEKAIIWMLTISISMWVVIDTLNKTQDQQGCTALLVAIAPACLMLLGLAKISRKSRLCPFDLATMAIGGVLLLMGEMLVLG